MPDSLDALLESPDDPARVARALERTAHMLNNPLGTATIEAWNLSRALDQVDRALKESDLRGAQQALTRTRELLGHVVDSHGELKALIRRLQAVSEDLEANLDREGPNGFGER